MTYPDRASPYSPQRPIIPADRQRVVEVLCLHFAADHIAMDSLEARLALAYEAPTLYELERLVSDLPALTQTSYDPGSPTLAPMSAVPERGVVMAMMGGASRKGSWVVPRNLKVLAFMGGAELDLRQARFAPGVTEIECTAFMGGIEITVPPGIRVETMGSAFMGGFESSAGDAGNLDPHAPVLRVSGMAILAGVDIKVRKPGKRMLARFQTAMQAAGLLPHGEE